MFKCIRLRNLFKTYHVVQELLAFSLSDYGRTGSQSDYRAHLLVVQYEANDISAKQSAFLNVLYRLPLILTALLHVAR